MKKSQLKLERKLKIKEFKSQRQLEFEETIKPKKFRFGDITFGRQLSEEEVRILQEPPRITLRMR